MTLTGEDVQLSARQAARCIWWCMNSAPTRWKYGALSQPSGRIAIDCASMTAAGS
jgi:hypothetical protein